jgi:hypothetical protein
MRWINEHKRIFRVTFLICLIIAISGPWFFDQISVPSQYPCSAPNVRLDDRFCGLPLSISWFFSEIFRAPLNILRELVAGLLQAGDAFRQSIIVMLLCLLLLPALSSAILIVRGERKRRPILHIVGLGLAAGIGGWIAWLGYSRASWMLWGVWLYIGLTASMFVLEVSIPRIPSKPVEE